MKLFGLVIMTQKQFNTATQASLGLGSLLEAHIRMRDKK